MYQIFMPIEWLVSYIFYGIHEVLAVFLGSGPGGAWILSIAFLTILIRICILPLFIKSIHSTRKLQTLQPQMRAIQKKYKGKKDQASREAMSRETMALYQEHGANPMGGCLPLLIQSPFFIALWQMLSNLKNISNGDLEPLGPINQQLASDFEHSSFFGISVADTLQTVEGTLGRVIIIIMIAIMCIVMFCSQRLVMLKNMPIAAKEGPQFKMQQSMVYIFPFMYIFSGAVFPVGMLIYMMTTNLWTLGQGIWQLEFMPTPGSEAAEKREMKLQKKLDIEKQLMKENDPEKYQELYGVPDERKKQREQPVKRKANKKSSAQTGVKKASSSVAKKSSVKKGK
ncbi:MAG: membrane protein insertase YidC [Candidatus Ancillula sp.]|jgi:YidC/Oxa1 family membrane protein insertase|nr:membrane protein insertase YidC [Candidatus Ancillula sp.]